MVGEDLFGADCEVRRADVMAQSEYQREEKLKNLDEIEELYQEIVKKGQCTSLKELAVTGRDLIACGMTPGQEIGRMLNQLLEIVLDDPEKNKKEILRNYVKDLRNRD